MIDATLFFFYFLLFLIFMFGASVASYLFVYQKRGKQSNFYTSTNRSFCEECHRHLNFFELIPFFSYIYLFGRCQQCKAKIPIKLFFGEFLLGLVFVIAFLTFELFYLYWALLAIFFLLTVEDLEDMQIDTRLLYLFTSTAILISILNFFMSENYYEVFIPILVFSIYWLIFLLGKVFQKEMIGEADPYVFTSLGIAFGSQFSISLFLYSVWLGTIYALALLYKSKKKVRIPFLPAIFVSTCLILILDFHILLISDILIVNEFLFK